MRTTKLATLVAGALGLLLLALPAAAAARDRNHDRIPDRWEKANHLSLKVNQAHRDQDRDGLDNLGEFQAGDNPRDADSDNDGIEDGNENAGTVQSFDSTSGRLVIHLFGGDNLSGLVTDQTEIECNNENEDNNTQVDSSDGEDSASSEDNNSGPGGDENANCTTANLTPGTAVNEAELHTEGGNAVFEKVELGS